jgi:hypothetical protein
MRKTQHMGKEGKKLKLKPMKEKLVEGLDSSGLHVGI